MHKCFLFLMSVLGLWLFGASQTWALTSAASLSASASNGTMTVHWRPTTDATIRYELRWKHFANAWAWQSIATNLDSTTGHYVFTFPPLADSTGTRGFCLDARAVQGTAASAWASETGGQIYNQMPLTTEVSVPIPTPVPPPSGLVISSATPEKIVISALAAHCLKVSTSTIGSTSLVRKRTVRCLHE